MLSCQLVAVLLLLLAVKSTTCVGRSSSVSSQKGDGSNTLSHCLTGKFSNSQKTECLPCKECKSENNVLYKTNCTSTSNAECQCKDGFEFESQEQDLCLLRPQCQEGEQLSIEGSNVFTYTCVPCPPNTFSNTMAGNCRPLTDCQAFDLITITPGNRTHNTKCGCHKDSCHSKVPLLVAYLLFTITLVILIANILLWRIMCKKQTIHFKPAIKPDPLIKEPAQQDDYYCCLSQEENGGKPVQENSLKDTDLTLKLT
ncbi:tumor necrosis factor receptor superfamily member 9-like [Polypterus senegalus]|uniref:tumor necrosis factor receptor superfamily member 9-like n=1 Tax=Polypterus senegalus TaxID=55291 RepID=UPI001964442F|nr:tumor necrosis factor receptor superfamily member 9-like [Polypterus senegalus]